MNRACVVGPLARAYPWGGPCEGETAISAGRGRARRDADGRGRAHCGVSSHPKHILAPNDSRTRARYTKKRACGEPGVRRWLARPCLPLGEALAKARRTISAGRGRARRDADGREGRTAASAATRSTSSPRTTHERARVTRRKGLAVNRACVVGPLARAYPWGEALAKARRTISAGARSTFAPVSNEKSQRLPPLVSEDIPRNDKGFQIRHLELRSRGDTGLEALRLDRAGPCRPARLSHQASSSRQRTCGKAGRHLREPARACRARTA